MRLTPDQDQPGLWIDDSWNPGTPGTFAIVIGISDYSSLDGSSESLKLGKLGCSALSAFRFFEWLNKDYFITNCPIVRCWLLLAPTKEELRLAPEMGRSFINPNFGECEKQIKAWVAQLKSLPAKIALQSRSVFFFSGHGLEVIEDRQLLLPKDYKPWENVDKALSTENISTALKDKSIKVPLHFLFVDACRKGHDKLLDYSPLTGTRILNEPVNKRKNPDAKVSVFYASAAGETAWEPVNPSAEHDRSVFSQAFIEGLRANGLDPDCREERCFIYIHRLQPFVETRMQQILREQYKSEASQKARMRGDFTADAVTELSRPQPTDYRPPANPPIPPDLLGPAPPQSTSAIGIAVEASATGSIDTASVDQSVLQSLRKARVYHFGSKAWLQNASLNVLEMRRKTDSNSYDFDIQIDGLGSVAGLHWLELSNRTRAIGCALRIDSVEKTVFHGQIDWNANRQTIDGFELTLSKRSGGLLQEAMALWEQSSNVPSDFYDGLALLSNIEAQGIASMIGYSPLGLLVIASTLSRKNRWDLIGNWIKNLAADKDGMTDAAVLWAERSLRLETGPLVEPLKYFMLMDSGNLPILSETLGTAFRQAEYYRTLQTLPKPLNAAIERVYQRLVRAVRVFRPGGLFTSYIGEIGTIRSDIVASPEVKDALRLGLSKAAFNLPRLGSRERRGFSDEVALVENTELEIYVSKKGQKELATEEKEAEPKEFEVGG